MGWVSPTGGSGWLLSERAYDDNEGNYAYVETAYVGWTVYLELTHAALDCDKLQFIIKVDVDQLDTVDINVYYDGGWHDVYEGDYPHREWFEKPILAGTKSVTAVQIRIYSETTVNYTTGVYEVDFWEVEATHVEITVPLADTVNGATLVPTFVRDMSFAVPLASTLNGAVLTPVVAIEPIINVPLATIDCAGIIPTMVRDMKPAIPLADTVNGAVIAPAMALDTKFAVPLADTINGATLTPTFVRDTKVTVPLATTTAIVAISPAIQPPRPWVINRSGLDDDYDTTHTRSGLDDDYGAVRPRSGKSSY